MTQGAYINYDDDEPQPASFTSCPNHTVFVDGKCFACGGPAEAIVRATHKMLDPGDVEVGGHRKD